jgi:endonuclease G
VTPGAPGERLLLDGEGRRQLRGILLGAFTRSKIDRALAEASPAHEFTHLVADGAFEDQIAELIDAAEREGWLGQFERILADELPERADLQQRLAQVLRAAADNARGLGGEGPPTLVSRGRLLTVAGIVLVLAAAGGVLGILAYANHSGGGTWPLILGVLGIVVGVIAAVLFISALWVDRLGDRVIALSRSKVPSVTVVSLAVLALTNGYFLWKSGSGAPPNFILKVIEKAEGRERSVSGQPVHLSELVGPGEIERRVQRVTDLNGEAFFHLRLGSGALYSGGIVIHDGDAWRDCVFPAFPALEERTFMQNVAALKCREGRGLERGAPGTEPSLRISNAPVPPVSLAAEVRDRLPIDRSARSRRAPLGVPEAPVILDHQYYSLGFDPGRRAPLWTAFVVERGRSDAPGQEGARFALDPDLPAELQSQPNDYRDSPYDRGQLVSGVDAQAAGEDAARQTRYYTAVVPQAGETNRGSWAGLERFTRDLANRVGPIHVLSGPIYGSGPALVMGPGKTHVPTSLYRVLLRRGSDGRWRAVAFVVLNDGSVESFTPESFAVPVREVETRTGLSFFPDLASEDATTLKATRDIATFSD